MMVGYLLVTHSLDVTFHPERYTLSFHPRSIYEYFYSIINKFNENLGQPLLLVCL